MKHKPEMHSKSRPGSEEPLNVGLFVTCLVDLFRPSVGFAAVKLLEDAGCKVHVPGSQTCCGQPAWNSGDNPSSIKFAKAVVEAFEGFDHVVAPSGSCAGMLKLHYPEALKDDPEWAERARLFAENVHELTSFLVDVLGVKNLEGDHEGLVTYHDSCAGLRELGISEQPRKLLNSLAGLHIVEMEDSTTCCGFGGTFCVKYSEISDAIVTEKTENIEASGARLMLAGDMGCLMNMAGKLSRSGSNVKVRHVAEVLSGITDAPPITSEEG